MLDRARCVEYASPNAVSALHQVGVHANPMDLRLGEIGLEEEMVRDAFAMATPVTRELERADTTVLVRCIPMLDGQGVSGAVVLFRDITEVRRRDRLLLSKDATIREIHHRVKNNLQTISSLLRLQGRRTDSPEARYAIEESVRRISSIALVHETLSREAGEEVPFVEILRPLVRMVEEAVSSPERNLRFEVVGEVGTLQPAIVTPMAVVLTELLQNAVDHAYPEGTAVRCRRPQGAGRAGGGRRRADRPGHRRRRRPARGVQRRQGERARPVDRAGARHVGPQRHDRHVRAARRLTRHDRRAAAPDPTVSLSPVRRLGPRTRNGLP